MAIRTLEKAASLLIMSLFALSVSAQVAIDGTKTMIGAGSDPHVSGGLVSYTNNTDVCYSNLGTGSKCVAGGSESDVSGPRIVFTRGTTTSAIYLLDTSSGNASESELAPSTRANRNPSIGNGTVAWEDSGQIVVRDLASGTTTRLTADPLLRSKDPVVSPDGNVVAWVKCQPDGTSCNIWQAKQVAGQWSSESVTGSEGEEGSPDTTGQIVVYSSKRADGTHIFWKPVAGGLESLVPMAGTQRNPRISGNLIAFESDTGGQWDLYMFDISTNTLYRIPDTGATLGDIAVSSTGQVTVVYTGGANVIALTFQHAINPSQRLSDLIAKVADAGWLHSVKVKLENALTKLDNGHLGPACNLLIAASNEIRSQSGKKIEASIAGELLGSLNGIREPAGCR